MTDDTTDGGHLLLETGDGDFVRPVPRRQGLEGHEFVEADVPREVDAAHAAGADPGDEGIRSEILERQTRISDLGWHLHGAAPGRMEGVLVRKVSTRMSQSKGIIRKSDKIHDSRKTVSGANTAVPTKIVASRHSVLYARPPTR